MRDVPYPADYDEAMRRFMSAQLLEGDTDVWLRTRADLAAQGLDAASVRRAEKDLITLRARSEVFLARLLSVGGLSVDDAVELGADLGTVAQIVGAHQADIVTREGTIDISDIPR